MINKILNEGIEEVKKYFPKMSDKMFMDAIKLDPTYKGGNELGKYGKWILKLIYNNIKNNESQKQFNDLLSKYPDGINPKTGKKFVEPTMLPSIKSEDIYKIPSSLKQYETLKKEIKKPIDSFNSLSELDTEINNIQKKGVPTNKLALKRYNLMQKAMEVGLKKVFEDEMWIVGIPTTLESSCMFGEDTRWCTTSRNNNYYDRYTKDGPLYINLNKETGELFQFHFPSGQFMNESDLSIDLSEILQSDRNLGNFYLVRMREGKTIIGENDNWLVAINGSNINSGKYLNINKQDFQTYIYDVDDNNFYINRQDVWLNDIPEYVSLMSIYKEKLFNMKNADMDTINFYITDIRNAKKEENGISGELLFSDMKDFYVKDYHSDSVLSFDFVQDILENDGWEHFDNDYQYDESDMKSAEPKYWDKNIAPYKLTWDDIVNIYFNNEIDSSKISVQQYDKIQQILFDECTSWDGSLSNLYATCQQDGAVLEAKKSIIKQIEDWLPIVEKDNSIFNSSRYGFNIFIPYEKISSILIEMVGNNLDDYSYNFWKYYINYQDSNESALSVSEPYYGWDGFDTETFNYEIEHLAEKIKKVLGNDDNPNNPNNSDDDLDKEISEVLRLAGISLNEIDTHTYLQKKELNNTFLYHGSPFFYAYYIFENNMINGNTQHSFNNNEYIGVSTSRNLEYSLEFPREKSQNITTPDLYRVFEEDFAPVIVFAFDKDTLKNKNKIIPHNYFNDDVNARLKGTTEYEELVVGQIKNVRSLCQKVIPNQDGYYLLMNKDKLYIYMLYTYYFLNSDYGDNFLEDMDALMIDNNYQYNDETEMYITPDGEEIDWEEYCQQGFELLSKEKFPYINEFVEFCISKLAKINF